MGKVWLAWERINEQNGEPTISNNQTCNNLNPHHYKNPSLHLIQTSSHNNLPEEDIPQSPLLLGNHPINRENKKIT